MSSDNKTRKRKYPEIQPVRASPQDAASTQRVMGRLMGRVPFVGDEDSVLVPTPDIKSSPDINSAEPLQFAADDIMSGDDINASPDIMSVRAEQWTAYPNDISDRILRTLELSDQVVLLRLYRLTRGFHKDTCKVTADALSRACNITSRQIPRSTQRLVARGLIEVIGHDFSNTNKLERGTIYRIMLPKAVDLKSRADIKARDDIKSGDDIKYTIKENTIKETHTNTEGVRVSSRFSLAECRKYAESLRADGITNPGGYATKIHRSGEADELIAKFLTPVESARPIDASGCPDCHGTGFYEPGGAGKGVARCKHERLLEARR